MVKYNSQVTIHQDSDTFTKYEKNGRLSFHELLMIFIDHWIGN